MIICHVCGAECEDTAELCPFCGAQLSKGEVEEKTDAVNEIKNPVLAASIDDPVTADIFGEVLTDAGIPFSSGDDGSVMHVGFGGSFFAVDVYVDEENLQRAQELYNEVKASEPQFEDEQ